MTMFQSPPLLATAQWPPQVQNRDEQSCAMTMVYLGPPSAKSVGPLKFKVHPDEVLILQSHTESGVKVVFKGSLRPNDVFNLKSARLPGQNLMLDICVNGMIEQRVFECCERGFLNESHYPVKRRSCQLLKVTGGVPCETCQWYELMNFRPNDDREEDVIVPTITYELISLPKQSTPAGDEQAVKGTKTNLIVNSADHIEHQSSRAMKALTEKKDELNAQANPLVNKNQESPDSQENRKQPNANDASKFLNEEVRISEHARREMDKILQAFMTALQTKRTVETDSVQSAAASATPAATHSAVPSERQLNAVEPATDFLPAPTTNVGAESFVLVWLDRTIRANKDTVASEKKLRAIVNSLVICCEISEATQVIDTITDQQVFLIVSGDHAQQLVKMHAFVDSEKLHSIYIFCQHTSTHQALMQSCSKVREVVNDIDPLCKRLKDDTEQALKNLLPITVFAGASDDDRDQTKFLCAQLKRDLLFTMEYNNNARLELASYCEKMYQSSPNDIAIIAKLKNSYHAGKALQWYTAQTFLYKMLNKAFHGGEISTLCKFNFFIKDLHTRLEQMHALYKLTLKSDVLTVYRGLSMRPDYFQRIIRAEVGKLIAFDSFLSTSLSEKQAKKFAKRTIGTKTESIVFHIEIDVNKMERPFADISRWSDYHDEEEVLFSIGTVFRIESVAETKTSEGIWVVKLKSVSETDVDLKKKTRQIQETLVKFFTNVLHVQRKTDNRILVPVSFANLASIYYNQRQYDESLNFYTKAYDSLRDLSSADPLTTATYLSNVAKVYAALKQEKTALGWYQKAWDIRRPQCEADDPSLIHILHTMGQLYRVQQRWDQALEQYQQVLGLEKEARGAKLEFDRSVVAATHVCIANIFVQRKKHADAYQSFSKALEEQRKHLSEQETYANELTQKNMHLSEHHPVLAFLYNNIGVMCYGQEDYKGALENQLKCLDIESKTVAKTDKTLIETYKNIASSYEKLRDFDKAEEFARRYMEQVRLHFAEGSDELNAATDWHAAIQVSRDIRK